MTLFTLCSLTLLQGGTIDGDEAVVKRRLDLAIQHLSGSFHYRSVSWTVGSSFAGQFPDRAKASEDLHTFAKQNEPRLYKLLKICMDTQADVKALVKARVRTVLNGFDDCSSFSDRVFPPIGAGVYCDCRYDVHISSQVQFVGCQHVFYSCSVETTGECAGTRG